MIKRKVLLLGLAVAVFSLTGCIDIIQSVTVKGDTVYSDISITLQKSAFEMASSMSGEDPDYDEFFDEGLLDDFSNENVEAESEEINSETEVGYFIRMNFKKDTVIDSDASDELYFIPVVDNKSISILFSYNDKNDGEEKSADEAQMDEMTNAVLGGCKYRLMLDGNEFDVTGAKLEGVKGGSVEVKKYGSIYVIEMPLAVWLTAQEDFTLKVSYKPAHYK